MFKKINHNFLVLFDHSLLQIYLSKNLRNFFIYKLLQYSCLQCSTSIRCQINMPLKILEITIILVSITFCACWKWPLQFSRHQNLNFFFGFPIFRHFLIPYLYRYKHIAMSNSTYFNSSGYFISVITFRCTFLFKLSYITKI